MIPYDAAEDVSFYFNEFLNGIIFLDTGLLMMCFNTWLNGILIVSAFLHMVMAMRT